VPEAIRLRAFLYVSQRGQGHLKNTLGSYLSSSFKIKEKPSLKEGTR